MNGKHQLTVEGLKKLENELERLKNEERPRVIELIKEARTQGDLSENADYDAARDEQARLESRIGELEHIIKNAEIIEMNGKGASSNLGKKITIQFLTGDKKILTFTLVSSSIEKEVKDNSIKISIESPIGAKVVNAALNEALEVRTSTGRDERFIITEIK